MDEHDTRPHCIAHRLALSAGLLDPLTTRPLLADDVAIKVRPVFSATVTWTMSR